ncbi:DUF3817 domain-containing protein [Paenibacillaceae bacterium]|nr:DUF3817 domain-containing protein [Paenibacillaceae bacterium]
MLKNPLRTFRIVSIVEGLSFLALLFIAMPLKYWADVPQPVQIIGGLHGLLFVLYLAAIVYAAIALRWTGMRIAGAVAAAILPFGPFVFDARLRRDEQK